MIINELIKIKISSANFKWFREKGFYPFKKNDIIEVNISDLMPNSKCIVRCICDICSDIKGVKYQNYKVQIGRGGYYVCSGCSIQKSGKTNLERYGFKSSLSNDKVREKSKNTMIKLYGVDNISKMDIVKENRSDNFKTDIFKEKSKKTWIDKYGVDNPSKSEEVKNKKIKTCLINNGVENPSQNADIFERSQKSGKKIKLHECGLMYRGTYEKDFLDFCFLNKINVQKGPTIEYIYNDRKKYYHSDFLLTDTNTICEIKSSYYYYLYLDKNLEKEKYSKMSYNFLFILDKKYEMLYV